jgi:hypothetical protein
MASAMTGRRRDLRARYTLEDNGLELAIAVGTDAAGRPPGLPLPAAALPARLAARVLLLRFVVPDGVAGLTQAQVEVGGAVVRWVATEAQIATLGALDAALQPDELAWFTALGAALQADPGLPGRWLLVHTEAALPAAVPLRLRAGATATTPPPGFEPRLAALTLARDPIVTSTAAAAWLNGIAQVVVVDRHPLVSERLRQRILLVGLENAFALTDLRGEDIVIDGGIRLPMVPVRWAWPLATIARVQDAELTAAERGVLGALAAERQAVGDLPRWLVVCTQDRGDFSSYTLRIGGDARFDPLLSTAEVNFKIDCAASLDCRNDEACAPAAVAAPDLDYLTRDFAGFRRLMLDRLAVLGAADAEPNPAGLWSTLVELVAARADQIAYAQDAVATEAYLHTARLRPSVRRHARLLDYRLHEGVNARAWVHLEAAAGVERVDAVAPGDLFVTRLAGAGAVVSPALLEAPLPAEAQVFHALLPLRRLSAALNAIDIYAWGEDDLCLPRGTTRCTLHDPGGALALHAGDVLVLESVASTTTGLAVDADPALRHVVRLDSEPVQGSDALLGADVLEISWLAEDALPFDLHARQGGRVLARARGNLVLVAHGRPARETTGAAPWGSRGRLRASLAQRGLTWATPAPDWAASWSATRVVNQTAAGALPEITLVSQVDGATWRPQLDLLASDRSAPEFWVEMESDGTARILFGDDITGRSPLPGATFVADYRIGNGSAGNVGSGAIAHLVSMALPATAVGTVRNPLPAAGGTEPESLDHARTAAPHAFRTQERAVTLEDWAQAALRSGAVQRAVATLRWSGSWHTVRVHVDPIEGRPADAAFIERMTAQLQRYRLAGYDLEVVGPVYAPLDIVLSVCTWADAWRESVAGALRTVFGTGALPDGTRAFFHPDNYTFGDSVYLSHIVAHAMAVPGVHWVDTRRENPRNRFRRWSSTAPDALESGVLAMGPLEVARCDSDPSLPERGRIQFIVEGGA